MALDRRPHAPTSVGGRSTARSRRSSLRNPPLERGEAELLDSRDTVPCDLVGEAADYTGEESRPEGVVGRQ